MSLTSGPPQGCWSVLLFACRSLCLVLLWLGTCGCPRGWRAPRKSGVCLPNVRAGTRFLPQRPSSSFDSGLHGLS